MRPADYRRLVALGLTPEQVAGVMEIMDSDDEERRAKGRARWRKHQENKNNTNVSQHEQTLANVPHASATRVEDKPLPQKIEPQESKKEQGAQARDFSGFKAELAALDPERLASLIKHRRAKRAQLSAHAARLFIRDAVACGLSLAEATDTCISRNWITVKPEFLTPRSRGQPPPQKSGVHAVFGALDREFGAKIDIRSEHGDGGVQSPVLNLPAVRHGRRY